MSYLIEQTNQIKTGVILTYVNIGMTIIVSLIYTPFLLRMLGQGEYGLFSIAFSAIGVFSILDMGFGNANIRYTAKYRASGDIEKEHTLHGKFFLMYLVIGLITLMLGFLLVYKTPDIFGENMTVEEISKLQIMLLFVVVSVSLSFPLSVFGFIIRGYERFVFAKLTEFLRIIMVPVLAVVLLLLGYRSVGIIAVISLLNVFLLIVNLLYCYKYLKIKLSFKNFDISLIKEILGYSFFVFLGVLSFRLNSNSNQFILGIISGAVPVAVYALGFNLVINFFTLSIAISGVFLPVITKIHENKNQLQEYNNYFTAIGRLQFYVLGLFYSGFVLFGKQFITLWAGPGYETSFYVCLMLISAISIYLIQTIGISILQAQNKHKFSSILFFAMSAISIVLSIFLSKEYGAIGGAFALAITYLIGQGIIMNIYYSKKIKLNISRFWKQIIKIIPSFIPPVIFGLLYLYYYNANTWLNLGIGVSVFAILYCLSVILFSFNKFEKETILLPAKHFFNRLF